MRRSEMVKKIHDVLWDITGTSWADEQCDEILSAIEKAGMTPPMTTGPSVIGRDSKGRPAGFDLGYLCGSREGYHRRLWECEDHELEQLKKELADDSWQEPED